jgi:hypothetical protein
MRLLKSAQPLPTLARNIGLSSTSAITAATTSMTAATTKTACQLPVQEVSTLQAA